MTVTLHPVGRGNKPDRTTIDVQLKSDVAEVLAPEDLPRALLEAQLNEDQRDDLRRLLSA